MRGRKQEVSKEGMTEGIGRRRKEGVDKNFNLGWRNCHSETSAHMTLLTADTVPVTNLVNK